jgi:hypothetical protein
LKYSLIEPVHRSCYPLKGSYCTNPNIPAEHVVGILRCGSRLCLQFPHIPPPPIRSSIPASHQTGNSTPLRLRACGLVNTRTVRFFKEFMVEEDLPSTQQLSQLAVCGTSTVNEEKKDDNVVDSFEPTYLYDAMREKRQLRPLLVCSRALLATSCY